MPLFFTGKGDKGKSVVGKKKYPKDSPILEVLGELDELNSLCGLARAVIKSKAVSAGIQGVQQNLFIIQANIAWLLFPKFQAPKLKEEKMKAMEKEIEAMENMIRPERGFVIPGTNEKAAWLDYARTVARRVERKVFALSKKRTIAPEILVYMNRLSSYLYALARMEVFLQHTKEVKPNYL